MCTWYTAPGTIVPMSQLSTCGAVPLMLQASPSWLSIDQLTPLPEGSGSLRLTPLAVPVPSASLLLTVMAKPMGLPALTVTASAVFTTVTSGHCTVVVASWLEVLPSLEASVRLATLAVAVLWNAPQLDAVVPLCR